jgi:hypothetical protein
MHTQQAGDGRTLPRGTPRRAPPRRSARSCHDGAARRTNPRAERDRCPQPVARRRSARTHVLTSARGHAGPGQQRTAACAPVDPDCSVFKASRNAAASSTSCCGHTAAQTTSTRTKGSPSTHHHGRHVMVACVTKLCAHPPSERRSSHIFVFVFLSSVWRCAHYWTPTFGVVHVWLRFITVVVGWRGGRQAVRFS